MNLKLKLTLLILLLISTIQTEEEMTQDEYEKLKKEIDSMVKQTQEEEDNIQDQDSNTTIPIKPIPPVEKPIDDEDDKEPSVEYENLPQAKILLPIRRFGTSNTILNTAPCGGVVRDLTNTITRKGSYLNFIWEVVKPEINGKCTVKISAGLENETLFETLYPTNGIFDKDGAFECGRTKGFEHKEFKLPENYECDGCILQWKWKTNYGNIYSCSDIIIDGKKLDACRAQCLNGGSCFNGICLCPNGFTGEFCEEEGEGGAGWLKYLAIIGALGAAGGAGYYGWKWYKGTDPWTTIRGNDIKGNFPGSMDRKNDIGNDFQGNSNSQINN